MPISLWPSISNSSCDLFQKNQDSIPNSFVRSCVVGPKSPPTLSASTDQRLCYIDEEYSCHDVMCTSFPILAFGLFFDVAVIGFNTEENLSELEDKGVYILPFLRHPNG